MEKKIDSLVNILKKDKDILAVSIFGSYARKEKYRDIDICVFLKPKKYTNLQMSKKRLNYLSEAQSIFDIQIFQQLPLYIRHRVFKEGKVIFCLNREALYDIAILNAKEWEDFKPLHESYLEGVKNG